MRAASRCETNPHPHPRPTQAACFLTPEQGAAPSVHAAAAQPAPTRLYFCPYFTAARLQPLLELAGPFAGARPTHCKATLAPTPTPTPIRTL